MTLIPKSTIGVCKTWLDKGRRKTSCPTYGRPVNLGNGWCMFCYDRKVSLVDRKKRRGVTQ